MEKTKDSQAARLLATGGREEDSQQGSHMAVRRGDLPGHGSQGNLLLFQEQLEKEKERKGNITWGQTGWKNPREWFTCSLACLIN